MNHLKGKGWESNVLLGNALPHGTKEPLGWGEEQAWPSKGSWNSQSGEPLHFNCNLYFLDTESLQAIK